MIKVTELKLTELTVWLAEVHARRIKRVMIICPDARRDRRRHLTLSALDVQSRTILWHKSTLMSAQQAEVRNAPRLNDYYDVLCNEGLQVVDGQWSIADAADWIERRDSLLNWPTTPPIEVPA
jgi:hypothetical protein